MSTIEQQNKTLEVMGKRVVETEKVGNIYRDLSDDLPEQVTKYKKFINQTKDDGIEQLSKAQDETVKETRQLELKKLELQEQMLSELSKLREQLLVAFDEYGDIAFSDEKARLDNFAIQLQSQDDARGYIMVYAGQKALVAEALTRGERAKTYLTHVRKLPPDKIVAIDGGYRESFTVQLFIAPNGTAAPIPMPNLDANQVQLIYEKKRRSRKLPD